MSTEKYAQYISRQQRQLSVSGTNTPVGTLEEALGSMDNIKAASKKGYEDSRRGQPPLSPKQKNIASQAGDPEKIDAADFKKLRAMKKEEAEIEEAKERSDRYLGTVDKDDPEYDSKVADMKKQAAGGARVRGRLGKDNPNRALYGKGGALKRMTAQDIKPEHAKRVDVYSKKSMKKEEIAISEEESAYIEEAVGKGKLPSILQYHKNNMEHHDNMVQHHAMMADKSEAVGDNEGWDYHTSRAMGHDMDREHHEARYNHAAGLAAKVKASKEIKDAEAKIRKARQAKKDW